MINSADGWAVGSDGCIIHWDGKSWSNVTSPTVAWFSCVDMVSSTDGWIAGADGMYRWQEEVASFPADYLIIMVAVVVLAVVLVWFFVRNRQAQAKKSKSSRLRLKKERKFAGGIFICPSSNPSPPSHRKSP